MRYTLNAAVLTTGYLAISANARPWLNPAATYSVVDVGGSSTEPANTVYATVTESPISETTSGPSTPKTVTEELTVTVAPTEPTATKSWTVSIGGTEVSALTTTASEPSAPSTLVVAETDTVFYNAPPGPPAPATTWTSCSMTSTAVRNAFPTAIRPWNTSISAISSPTATGSFTHKKLASGVPYASSGFEKRWIAATGTGAYKRCLYPTHGSGVYEIPSTQLWDKRGAGPTGTGGYLAERAAPTAYEAPSWNSTNGRYLSD